MKYKNQPIKKYLDDLAKKSPAPGGGSASALAAALGCALLSMAANFTIGKEKYKKHEKEIKKILKASEKLRKRFIELMDLDVEAYSRYANAKNKKAKEKAKKESQGVVKEIASLCYEAIALCSPVAEKGNIYLLNDVLGSAELLSAGFNSALVNIE